MHLIWLSVCVFLSGAGTCTWYVSNRFLSCPVDVMGNLWSPRLGRRGLDFIFLIHLFVYLVCVTFCLCFSFPLGVMGSTWIVKNGTLFRLENKPEWGTFLFVKIISFILSPVNQQVVRKREIPVKKHLTTRKQNMACLQCNPKWAWTQSV